MGDFASVVSWRCSRVERALIAARSVQLQLLSLGIRHALIAVSTLFAWAGVHYVLAARDLRRDLETHYQTRRTAE